MIKIDIFCLVYCRISVGCCTKFTSYYASISEILAFLMQILCCPIYCSNSHIPVRELQSSEGRYQLPSIVGRNAGQVQIVCRWCGLKSTILGCHKGVNHLLSGRTHLWPTANTATTGSDLVMHCFNLWSSSVLWLVSNGMGDNLRAGKPSRYVTSQPGQLSLAIPPWLGAVSNGDG